MARYELNRCYYFNKAKLLNLTYIFPHTIAAPDDLYLLELEVIITHSKSQLKGSFSETDEFRSITVYQSIVQHCGTSDKVLDACQCLMLHPYITASCAIPT